MEKKYKGLNDSEVINNQKLYGLNIISNNSKNKFVQTLKNPLMIILIFSIILYLFFNQVINSIIVLLITIIIIIIDLAINNKINKLLNKLNEITNALYTVIRNSNKIKIKREEITINDIVILNAGEIVPADSIILESNNLKVNEKPLNNNNNLVKKSIDLIDKDTKYKSNYLYKSSIITNGYAIVKVTDIGNKSEISKINTINIVEQRINKIDKIIKICSIITLILITVLVTIKNNNLKLGITMGIICFIAIFPLNLPSLTNLFLLILKDKFFKNNLIIKDWSIIKKLNSITCLCIDKEKFITKGKLEIKNLYTSLNTIDYMENLLLAKEKKKDNQIENAIIEYSNILGIQNINNEFELIKSYPFTNESKLNANVYKKDEEYYIFIKGSLESLFDICNLNVEEKYELHNLQKRLSKKGFEIVGSASKKIKKIEDDIFDYRVDFDGLITLQDNLNDTAKENIRFLKDLDINIIMLSKDNKEITNSIGKQIELNNYHNIVDRKEIDKIKDNDLNDIVKNTNVFCNITPKNKLRIIKSLKNNDEFVCVTGYETSDIECFNYSDVSISIKQDISKNIADITIINDNFDVFVNTIKEVKLINEKVKKKLKLLILYYIVIILATFCISLFKPIYSLIIIIIIIKIIINIYLVKYKI